FAILITVTGQLDLLGDVGAEVAAEPLPLDRQETMALKVAKRAVVGRDLEPVSDRLEPAAGLVAPVLPHADELRDQRASLRQRHRRNGRAELGLGQVARLVEACGDELLLAAAYVEQPHGWAVLALTHVAQPEAA